MLVYSSLLNKKYIFIGLFTSMHFNTAITRLDKENSAACPDSVLLSFAVILRDIVSDPSLFSLNLSVLIPTRGFKMYLQY